MAGKDNAKKNRAQRRRLARSYFSTIVSISLVLLLVGAASLVIINAKSVSDWCKEQVRVTVMLGDEVSDSDALEFMSSLESEPYVKNLEFISKEQGTEEMAMRLGADFLEVFEESPIPASIDVALEADYVHPDSLTAICDRIASSSLVESVDYQEMLVEKLDSNIRRVSLIAGCAILILLFISFVLINNTVRLSVFAKRFTVHTMKLVGATRHFIRKPFMLRAMFQGVISAFVAMAMMLGLMFLLKSGYPDLFSLFRPEMLLIVMGIILASGFVICCISTYFVVNKLIGLDKDDLYY